MKRLVLLFLVLCLLCTACASSQVLTSEHTATEFSMAYERYTATESTTISVNDGATVTLTGSLVTQSGSVSVVISNADGETVHSSENTGESFTFHVILSGPNTYTITVDCQKHTGSFSFTWETTGAQNQEH